MWITHSQIFYQLSGMIVSESRPEPVLTQLAQRDELRQDELQQYELQDLTKVRQ